MVPVSIETIAVLLDQVTKEALERWGNDLHAVVLFGSFARGEAHQHSDVDLLLVVRHLPREWRERSAIELSFERLGLQWGRPIQIMLVEPEEISLAVDQIQPLLLEILGEYRCWFDRNKFFQSEMQRFRQILLDRGVRRLAKDKWEVPEHARS